jgi:hypothetical protein
VIGPSEHEMNEQSKIPADILDPDFREALKQLLARYSLKLEYLHRDMFQYNDAPQDWVELHVIASPVTAS